MKVHLTDLGNGFGVLSHGFGIPNVRDRIILKRGVFYCAG
jgi:hypothetical protein